MEKGRIRARAILAYWYNIITFFFVMITQKWDSFRPNQEVGSSTKVQNTVWMCVRWFNLQLGSFRAPQTSQRPDCCVLWRAPCVLQLQWTLLTIKSFGSLYSVVSQSWSPSDGNLWQDISSALCQPATTLSVKSCFVNV